MIAPRPVSRFTLLTIAVVLLAVAACLAVWYGFEQSHEPTEQRTGMPEPGVAQIPSN